MDSLPGARISLLPSKTGIMHSIKMGYFIIPASSDNLALTASFKNLDTDTFGFLALAMIHLDCDKGRLRQEVKSLKRAT
jgi:hypothetical protein